MAIITCSAKVREDGALAIPQEAQQALELKQGDEVEIVVRKPATRPRKGTKNPLYRLYQFRVVARTSGRRGFHVRPSFPDIRTPPQTDPLIFADPK